MKDKIRVVGGNKLFGTLHNQTSKNAILPIMAGAILNCGTTQILNVPHLLDIENMCKLLKNLGAKVELSNDLLLDCSTIQKTILDMELSKKLRSSIFLLGPMLARFKKATITYPGGCDIGNRPIDLHLSGLKELGVKIVERHSLIVCDGSKMRAGTIHLDFASVGATENLMMSAVFLKGETRILNSAKEPEIVDLQNFLNSMGANITGAGTSEIVVRGVEKLHNTNYSPIGDRIVAGTYLIACAMTGGKITITNINPEHLTALLHKLKKAGCEIEHTPHSITLESDGKLDSINLTETAIFPGFPTDLQAQFLCMQTVSNGVAVVVENLFENRFKHALEFAKMGADILLKDRVAVIRGVDTLQGAPIEASDLRGGASLVLAGLIATGYTTISNIHHIARGYEDIVRDLSTLGADINYVE